MMINGIFLFKYDEDVIEITNNINEYWDSKKMNE
jgi:hypothetical protein